MKKFILLLGIACHITLLLRAEEDPHPRMRLMPVPAAAPAKVVKPPRPYPGQQKFEYLARYIGTGNDAGETMNKLGEEGWELVAALPPSGNALANLCYFKRPIVAEQVPANRRESVQPEVQKTK